MNHAYRLVWNAVQSRYVPAPETARGVGKHSGRSLRRSAVAMALGTSLLSLGALAGPTGGAVSAGNGSISQSGTNTTITQTSQNLAINWASFSTAAGESVNFVQPNSSAIALNRVIGSDSSVLNGSLSANGQVWILNPNGVLFGSTASVNVGGLVASTLSMSDADFLAGKRIFSGDGTQGSIVNQGSLTGGYVALLGKQVSNTGTIATYGVANGMTALAAGDKITLDFNGNQLLRVQIDEGTFNALVQNKGLIRADNGTVILTASAKDALLDTVVNNEGVIQARGMDSSGGRILLLGGINGGTVKVGGTLDASATGSHNGGFIETSGAHVQVADGAKISTLSDTGKTGTWLIDPTDFTISSGSGSQTTSGMGATTLSNNLASNNISLTTDNSTGTDSGDINVNAAVSWSANTTLTLNAYNNINVNAAITATGTSAGLALNYGGDYNIAAPITLSGASATLALNGTSYTLIHSMAQLVAINSTGLGGRYALAQDLDASGTTYTSAVVGSLYPRFSGTFAGLGHTISGLTISTFIPNMLGLGLFSQNSGTIRDLGLLGGSVSGGDVVGALVGTNYGTLRNVYSTSTVSTTGDYAVGGLVGENDGTIGNAYATGNVSGHGEVGGLVGYNRGDINNAYATGNVLGLDNSYGNTGGLVGSSDYGGNISKVSATGSVSGGYYRGGLVGQVTDGVLSRAYWDSTTTGQSAAVGLANGTSTNVSAVTSSTAYKHSSYTNLGTWTETVAGSGVWVAKDGSGNKLLVMVEGATRPFLYSEYSTSIHNAHQLQLMAYDLSANYTLSANIDASATSGSNASGMWTTSGFSPVGNSTRTFDGSLDGQGHEIANLSIIRLGNFDIGLFGVASSASTIRNVGLIGGSVSGTSRVGALVGYNFGGISNVYSAVAVSGSGSINWGSSKWVGGLIGINVGSISNAYATGSVTGFAYYMGGLVGENDGSIGNAHATGSVSGYENVGGLVGENNGGSISNAYATGRVSGEVSNIGGLVGSNRGSIGNAYATGRVTGENCVGGLVGGNYGGGIRNAYATGTTGALSFEGGLVGYNSGTSIASFWLNSISTTGFGLQTGTVDSFTRGLSDSEAKSTSTYINAGWDVATVGGSSSVWRIYDGYTMPLLRSFLTSLTVASNNTSKVYDGTTSLSDSYTLSDSNANTSRILGTASYSTNSKNVGRYAIGTSGLYSSQQGYDISYVNGTADITVATLRVSGATVANKTYDGTTSAMVSGGSLSGLANGDSVTLSQSGTFGDKNVGGGKTVAETFAISGTDAGNYVLASSSATTTADIGAATLTVSGATAANRTYDGTTSATVSGGSLNGLVNGESVTLGQSGTFGDKSVGSGKTVTETFALSGTDAGNYVLSSSTATTTGNINAANLTVTANSASKTADGVAYHGGNGVQYSGFVNGETSTVLGGNLVYGGAAQGATAAGSYRLSAGGLSAGNYALTYVDGSLVINAAPTTTDSTPLAQVQQSLQTNTQPGTTTASDLALASATSRALDVQSCGMRLPDGMVCH